METRKNDATQTVSLFEHENDLWHMSTANRRMLIALIVVCVTFIATIIVFVHGYTVREKNWLDTLMNLRTAPAATEVQSDGIYKQPGS